MENKIKKNYLKMIVVIFIVFMLCFTSCRKDDADVITGNIIKNRSDSTINDNLTQIVEIDVDLNNLTTQGICFVNESDVYERYGFDVNLDDFCILSLLENKSKEPIIGGDIDEYGCKGSAGYVWCESLGECIRPWETNCSDLNNQDYDNAVNETNTEDKNEDNDIDYSKYFTVVEVNETKTLKLQINTNDPDNDDIKVTYPEPFDVNGVWETKNGDHGNYEFDITISDGIVDVTTLVLVIVNEVNFPPTVSVAKEITVNEGDLIELNPKINDPDNDELSIFYVGFMDTDSYMTTYDDSGVYDQKIIVSDGEFEVVEYIKIIVENVNRLPIITFDNEITAVGGETITLDVKVDDPDGDDVEITYLKPFNDNGEWKTDKLDDGIFKTYFLVDDGYDVINQSVTIDLNRFNSKPEFNEVDFVIDEDTTFDFNDIVTDSEGDEIELDIEQIDGSKYDNKTSIYFDFFSAGEYKFNVTAKDYELENNKIITIKVNNKNRKPILDVKSEYKVLETETVVIEANYTDLDGDELTITYSKPLDNTGKWVTTYDDSGVWEVDVSVNDGYDTVTKTVRIEVENKNRAPVIENVNDISVKEGELIKITPNIYDPDGDEIEIKLEGFLNAYEYQTTYDDSGVYTSRIIVTDDQGAQTIKEFKVTIENVNRAPEIVEITPIIVN